VPGDFEGVANALLFMGNGVVRAAIAPDGALTGGNTQAGMQIEGDARVNGSFDVAAEADFENHVEIAGDLTVNGTMCGNFCSPSDRNLKDNIQPVDSRHILEQVSALPISSWTYKNNMDARHVGPMAQDFHAAFGLGNDDKHISTIDEGGVALAAIQGLNQKVEEQNAVLRKEKEALEQRVAALEELIRSLQKK
jgi:hypothetical protein